jgi:hypothetical protein
MASGRLDTTTLGGNTMNKAAKGLAVSVAAAALALAQGGAATAQQARLNAQTVVDRAEIEDLLSRYYWNFGGSSENFANFYTPDAELVLGAKSYKGTAGIESAYKGVPADTPQRRSFSFNVLPSNVLISVHGDTAVAQLVFTEIVIDKQGDAPRILTQGREFDHLARYKGRWLISKRQIMGANAKPDDWPK